MIRIESERELLEVVRKAIEDGEIPMLCIAGTDIKYEFPLTYLSEQLITLSR